MPGFGIRRRKAPLQRLNLIREIKPLRHAELDAASGGSKRCKVWEFKAAGPRVKRGATRKPISMESQAIIRIEV